MRRLPLLLLTAALATCSCNKASSPTWFELFEISETSDGHGIIEGGFKDPEGNPTKVEHATLHYTVYAGHPKAGHVRCAMSFEILAQHFNENTLGGLGFQVPVEFAEHCEPLPEGEMTYGMVVVELPEGVRLEDTNKSWVPKSLGGSGQLELPAIAKAPTEQASGGDPVHELVDRLGRLAKLSADAAPPLGLPCDPPPTTSGVLLRADRRVLAWLAADGQGKAPGLGDTFLATNGYNMLAIAEYLGERTPPKRQALQTVLDGPVDFVEIVVTEQLEQPNIIDPGASDREGSFRPGVMKGEVWIVDAKTETVLCRNAVVATDIQAARGDQFDSSASKLAQQFAGATARAITGASAQIAPGLRAVPRP